MSKIYLAGPIANISYRDATDWRTDIAQAFNHFGIETLSPMRGHLHLTTVTRMSQTLDGEEYRTPLRTAKGIMIRDYTDVSSSNLIFVNFLGADRVSMGTVMEIGWAYEKRIPIVAVMEPDGSNPHEHGMVNEAIGFKVPSLAEAVDVARCILNVSDE